MRISGRRDYLINLESVAMTDIVLNMFIFFFISFSLLYTFSPERVQKLDIKLPEAENTAPIEGKKQIDIVLKADGSVYIGKDRVSMSGLRDAVKARYKGTQGMSVILRSDRTVYFKQIVNVLDILTELKIDRLSIATVNEKD